LTVLTMSLLLFSTLNVAILLLSMGDKKNLSQISSKIS